MQEFDNSEFEKYKAEAKERWGNTDAYSEYKKKTKDYSQEKYNGLVDEMDNIFAEFAVCMKKGDAPDCEAPQKCVKHLQCHITENYYTCTKEILAGLGQMYVLDERFRDNIDKHTAGTAQFVAKSIEIYCRK